MKTTSWLKGVVVALGVSLGGAALASGPAPVRVVSAGMYERQHHERDFDGSWNDGWRDAGDRMDRHGLRLFRLGRQKVADGRALQLRGERLLERARWARSPMLAQKAHRMIYRGELLEREGRMLIRRVRS